MFPSRADFAISEYKNSELREDSLNIVRLACDLPFLSRKDAEELEFSEEYLYKHKHKSHNQKEIWLIT